MTALLPRFGNKFPNKAAAHQPCERLNKKIPGIVLTSSRGPFQHREMAYQNDAPIVEQCESRWTMRQPTDVFRRPAQQRSFRRDQAAIRGRTHRFNKSKDNAFGGPRLKKLVICGIDEISDEKPAALARSGRARGEKPVPAQRSARLEDCAILPQVRCGERSNPEVRREVRSSVRIGFPAHPAQRPSNG